MPKVIYPCLYIYSLDIKTFMALDCRKFVEDCYGLAGIDCRVNNGRENAENVFIKIINNYLFAFICGRFANFGSKVDVPRVICAISCMNTPDFNGNKTYRMMSNPIMNKTLRSRL